MLWHFYGVMGSGKSWGCVVFAEDFYIKEARKVYANFKTSFGELIDIADLLNFKYENCVIILDEAYGLADSHSRIKANDSLSEVILQSRKRDVDAFIATQNEGDLYKRIREVAERKVLCQNMGTKKEPILRYLIMDNFGQPIEALEFDTKTVKSAYGLYNSFEVIMPMHLNKGTTFEKVAELYNDVPKRKPFITLLNQENPFITLTLCETIFELMELEKYDRIKKLLNRAV